MKAFAPRYLLLALLAGSVVTAVAQEDKKADMSLTVDETQAARQIAFVHEEIVVMPGGVTLSYPRWIPGEHGPTGPIQQVAVLRIRSGDKTLAWTRDPDDMNDFHVNVPSGTDHITVDFDALNVNRTVACFTHKLETSECAASGP